MSVPESADPTVDITSRGWVIKPSFYAFLNQSTALFFHALLTSVYILIETGVFTLVEISSLGTFGDKDPVLKEQLEYIFLYTKIIIGFLLALLMLVRMVKGYKQVVQ